MINGGTVVTATPAAAAVGTQATTSTIDVHAVAREADVIVSGVARALKVVLEVAMAVLAIVVLAPAMLAIAMSVRLTSPGPALFRQTRVGRDGRQFTMFKFRTMYADAEKMLPALVERNEVTGGVLFKLRVDPRVTRVGRVLRRLSLDELPQLFNVVLGSMSLVGPRPQLPSEVAQLEQVQLRRLQVRPGLTGLWQVSGRSDLTWDESIGLDLRYVDNWSLALDAVLLAKTVRAVVTSSGAY